jgi:hypothetical protein
MVGMPATHFATPETAIRPERAAVRAPQSSPPARRIAAPLVVGRADDAAEREADRVADDVIARLRSGEGDQVHAHDAACGHDVARSAGTTPGTPEVGYEGGPLSEGLSGSIERARGGGSSLPDSLRSRLEPAFGSSLAGVRIHTDGEAARLNRMISARAFTTGNDIFFGSGEFRPHTPAGERMLAHELAHTRQQVGVGRLHRLWDLDAPQIDWTRTDRVGTIPSGQAVFFMTDSAGDKIVVKSEDREVGLGELSSVMHENLANVKSVRHRKLGAPDRQAIGGLLGTKNKLDAASWTELGNNKKDVGWLKQDLKDRIDGMDPVDIAQYFQQSQMTALGGASLIAMSYASGATAAKVGKSADPNQMKPEKSRMRSLLMDYKHMINVGQLTAVDAFMGNQDRALVGNMGNWIYDPYTAAITTIDHVDDTVQANFKAKRQTADDVDSLLGPLAKGALGTTAKKVVVALANGLSDPKFSDDKDIVAWMDGDGGYRRESMEEAVTEGLKKGRELLVKTFTATRFTLGGSKSRKVKKSIKAAAQAAHATDEDTGDPDFYYKVLKARAQWLKKH